MEFGGKMQQAVRPKRLHLTTRRP